VSLASVILLLGEVLEVCDLLLAGVVLPLGPAVQGLDLLLPGVVLGVELAVQLGDVRDAVLVVLLLPLLQRFDLVFPEVVLPLGGVDQSVVILPQGVVVSPQSVDLALPLFLLELLRRPLLLEQGRHPNEYTS